MKSWLFWLCMFPSLLFAQSKYTVGTRLLLHDLKKEGAFENRHPALSERLIQNHALQFRNGTYWAAIAIKIEESQFQEDALFSLGAHINSRYIGLRSIECPVQVIPQLLHLEGVLQIDAGAEDAPNMETSLSETYADSAKAGLGLPKGLSGKNVVVSVIDWGFDYTHPNYYSADLQDYRVKRVWDQNLVGGTPPQGYSYGAEHATQSDILAAEHDDPYVFGMGSHGTHTSGIAAGGGAGTPHQGIAHEAELILLPYRRNAASLLDLLNYTKNYSNTAQKPFVFNMSTGSHLGPHDGSDLKNQAISQTVGKGAVFVGSAGNNGQNEFHLDHEFSNDTLSTVCTTVNTNAYWGQCMAIWGAPNQNLHMGFSLVNNTGDTLYTFPYLSSAAEPLLDTVVYFDPQDSTKSFEFKLLAIAADANNLKPNFRFEFRNLTGLRVATHFYANTGRMDIWHIIRLEERYTNWGLNLQASFAGGNQTWTGYKKGDWHYGVGEPSGAGPSVITVGAYQSTIFMPNGSTFAGNLANFTSYGPTVDGRNKPDIAAPGVSVASAVSSFDPSVSTNLPTVSFNGKTYHFQRYSGTSMSGPTVAGIVALMLEANPDLSWQFVRDIITSTARQDANTGTLPNDGHVRWGFGKINAWQAIFEVFNTIQVKNYHSVMSWHVYPNPNSVTFLYLDASGVETGNYQVKIYNTQGVMVKSKDIQHQADTKWELETEGLAKGLYIIQVEKNTVLFGVSRVVIQ